MKILVGLGNPGAQYSATRHNVGFRFLDQIARHEGLHFSAAPRFHAETVVALINNRKVLLVKPQTFMNDSGDAIGALMRYYQLQTEDITVVYDDLDLSAGKIKLKKGGGHGGHNGLKSLNQHLPDRDYFRVKIGIARPPHNNITGWVLGQADEADRISEACAIDAVESQLASILSGDIAKASNEIHLRLAQADD